MAFESLSDKLSAAFKKLRGKGRLTAADVKEAMKEVRMALLEADVSYKVVKEFTKSVTERASGADVLEALSPAQQVIKIVNEELVKLMGSENQRLSIGSKSPSVVMLVGLQGAGKTTNGAKLAAYMRKQGKRPLLAVRYLSPGCHKAAGNRRQTARHPRVPDGNDKSRRYRKGRSRACEKARQRPCVPRYGRPPAH